jgi:hypothetical protein
LRQQKRLAEEAYAFRDRFDDPALAGAASTVEGHDRTLRAEW